jgi:hypothetical protein
MTLNLILTSREPVFLSGDFRLTWRGKPVEPDNLDTQKLVPVIKRSWQALMAFTGVARTHRGTDVGDWVADQVSDIALDAPFEELVVRLKSAQEWLGQIPGDSRLAFSVVGFVGRRPVAMCVSNFTDLFGRHSSSMSGELEVSRERPKTPRLRALGDATAVLDAERLRLLAMLSKRVAPTQVQLAMAETNMAAASRSFSISPECVTGFLLASGAAEITPHGIKAGVEYLPSFVKRQLSASGVTGFRRKFDDTGVPLAPQWVGMTAKVENRPGRPWAVGIMHAVRNVMEPVGGTPPSGTAAFWKVAGENEPPTTTFRVTSPDKPRTGAG